MFGMIVKITAAPGKQNELIDLLKQSAAGMPGCLSYVIAKDSKDENVLWVTEVWDSQASHEASLSLPAVKSAVPEARLRIAAFERVAVTTPVADLGRASAATR